MHKKILQLCSSSCLIALLLTHSALSQERGTDVWLVILGSYPPQRKDEAFERRLILNSQGIPARVITSDSYGNLTKGLYIVALGPFHKSRASSILSRAKLYVPDSYIKTARISNGMPLIPTTNTSGVPDTGPRPALPSGACSKFPELC